MCEVRSAKFAEAQPDGFSATDTTQVRRSIPKCREVDGPNKVSLKVGHRVPDRFDVTRSEAVDLNGTGVAFDHILDARAEV